MLKSMYYVLDTSLHIPLRYLTTRYDSGRHMSSYLQLCSREETSVHTGSSLCLGPSILWSADTKGELFGGASPSILATHTKGIRKLVTETSPQAPCVMQLLMSSAPKFSPSFTTLDWKPALKKIVQHLGIFRQYNHQTIILSHR